MPLFRLSCLYSNFTWIISGQFWGQFWGQFCGNVWDKFRKNFRWRFGGWFREQFQWQLQVSLSRTLLGPFMTILKTICGAISGRFYKNLGGQFQDNFGDNSVKFVNNYVTIWDWKTFQSCFRAKMQKNFWDLSTFMIVSTSNGCDGALPLKLWSFELFFRSWTSPSILWSSEVFW